jgi:hypothetical protein
MSDHTNVPFQLKIVEPVESNYKYALLNSNEFECLVLRADDGDNALVGVADGVRLSRDLKEGRKIS